MATSLRGEKQKGFYLLGVGVFYSPRRQKWVTQWLGTDSGDSKPLYNRIIFPFNSFTHTYKKTGTLDRKTEQEVIFKMFDTFYENWKSSYESTRRDLNVFVKDRVISTSLYNHLREYEVERKRNMAYVRFVISKSDGLSKVYTRNEIWRHLFSLGLIDISGKNEGFLTSVKEIQTDSKGKIVKDALDDEHLNAAELILYFYFKTFLKQSMIKKSNYFVVKG